MKHEMSRRNSYMLITIQLSPFLYTFPIYFLIPFNTKLSLLIVIISCQTLIFPLIFKFTQLAWILSSNPWFIITIIFKDIYMDYYVKIKFFSYRDVQYNIIII
jgi:hypothetical protein